MAMRYDVIVVGAGPAGATAARLTAAAGVRTLLIEKERLPRYKPCGGALTPALRRCLELDYTPVVERVAREVTFISGGRRGDQAGEWRTHRPPRMALEMVSRARFDLLLADAAVQRGAQLVERRRVVSVEVAQTRDAVIARSDKGESWRAQLLVAADGAASRIGRQAGFAAAPCGLALEAELAPRDAGLLDEHGGRAFIALGAAPGGYAWLLPKGDHFSVGVMTSRSRFRSLAASYERFRRSIGFLRGAREMLRRGALLPLNRGPRLLNTERICLVGDAASLVDPLTAEGIRHAVRSGALAAEAVVAALQGGGLLSRRYTESINRLLVRDFDWARRAAALLARCPGLLPQSRFLVGLFDRLASGELTYRDLCCRPRSWFASGR